MSNPKLATFIDRLSAVMLYAGVEQEQLKATICAICDMQSVDDWFSDSTKTPSAENIATLSAYFCCDCVWLITGKYSSEEAVCDKHNDEIFSCTLVSQKIKAKGVTFIRNYED